MAKRNHLPTHLNYPTVHNHTFHSPSHRRSKVTELTGKVLPPLSRLMSVRYSQAIRQTQAAELWSQRDRTLDIPNVNCMFYRQPIVKIPDLTKQAFLHCSLLVLAWCSLPFPAIPCCLPYVLFCYPIK